MSKAIKIVLFLALAVVIIGGFYYWQMPNSADQEVKKYSGPVEDVTVRLKWLHQAQFAGHYVADQKGYYQDQGINVTLKSFDFKNFPIEEVNSGLADFGVTGADELIIAREKGYDIKALAVIYQENPVTAFSLKSSGIKGPADMIGKKIGIQKGVNVEFQIQAMMDKVGASYENDVTIVPVLFDASEIMAGEVDVSSGYITNEPILVEEKGYEVNLIRPADYGVNLYADVIFTTDEMIKNKPDLVKRFVDATLKGWEYAIEHKDEAVRMTLLYEDPNNPALNFNHQMALLEKSIPLIKPNPGTKIGQMRYSRWKKTFDIMKKYNLIKGDSRVDVFYTTDFLD